MQHLLHPFANRGTGFVWYRLPVDPYFQPRRLAAAAQAVADYLMLSAPNTDYYLLGPLQALASCPWMLEPDISPDTLSDLAAYPVPRDTWGGGYLRGWSSGAARFARKPTTWPVDLRLTLTRTDAASARLVTGDASSVVGARLIAEDDILVVDWPGEFGASGVVAIDAAYWLAGGAVEIDHHPASYPYAAVVDTLAGNVNLSRLLVTSGLAEAWHATFDPLERVALVALALVRAYHAA